MINQNISNTPTPNPLGQQSQMRAEKLGASRRVRRALAEQQKVTPKSIAVVV